MATPIVPVPAPSEAITIQVGMSLAEVERLIIYATLRLAKGNHSRSARVLGIDRTTLYDKLKRYQIAR
jgi:DNA-binding protein Fis